MRAVVVLVVLAGVAVAQPPPKEFTRELDAGIDAFRLGKYDDAKKHLDLARNLDLKQAAPHRYLAAIAQAQMRWEECIDAARKALSLDRADTPHRADTRRLHDACRTATGRPDLAADRGELGEFAALAVTSNPPGASVKVRDLVYGGTPMAPHPLAAGRISVELVKSGFLTANIDIDALPGIITDVHVDMTPGVQEATPLPIPFGRLIVPRAERRELLIDGRPVAGSRIELAPGVHIVEVREPGKEPWRRRVAITADRDTHLAPELVDSGPRESRRRLAKILIGTGAVAAGFAVGAFYISRGSAEDARDILRIEIARMPGETSPPIRTRDDFNAARDRANRWATISNLSWGAALAAAGTGIFLLYRNRDREGDAPEFAIAPVRGGAIATTGIEW